MDNRNIIYRIYRRTKINKNEKIKDEDKILIMLAFFSISIGLWVNTDEYADKLCREWQRYIMKKFIEERRGK